MSISVKGLNSFKKEIQEQVKKLVSDIQETYQSEVRKRTPIDTGNARRGWQKRTKSGNAVIENQVPYIERLEGGYSRQAPRGFVNQAVNATVRKFK